ncbi:MAG: DNA-processing protein DprA [Oscillospiraceae bacterium]|jgi:DNA processing protein|nr:DNA-processing protein DprA [Oscillospiraceae bacterium]
MPELIYWIWFSRLTGMKPETRLRILERCPDIHELYEAAPDKFSHMDNVKPEELRALENKDIGIASAIYERCLKLGVTMLPIISERYPERLANVFDAPIILYVLGAIPKFDDECAVAIVGTRRASRYGLVTAEKIGFEVADSGGLVVTGLAAGIDSAAASGALRGGGKVAGVLGTGIDIVFPSDNARLFREVARNGCLISEYPPGERATRFTFPARNRVIAGLSLGVCIVEAPVRSGSLITANRASEYGRDVFVVPGSIDQDGFKGSNELLRDGAELAVCGWDLIGRHVWRFPNKLREPIQRKEVLRRARTSSREYNADPNSRTRAHAGREAAGIGSKPEAPRPRPRPEGLTDDETKVLDAITGRKTADQITMSASMRPDRVMVALTLLELKGLVKNMGDMSYESMVD